MDIKKKIGHFFSKNLIFLGIFIFMVFFSMEMIGFWFFEKNIYSNRVDIAQAPLDLSYTTGRVLVFISIVGCLLMILLCIFFIWRNRKTKIQSLEKIIQTGQVLLKKDYASLVTTIVELAQGNLAIDLSVQAKSLPTSKRSGSDPLVNVINSVIKNLQETTKLLKDITGLPCSRLCYVGADSFLEGRQCGKVMGEALGGKGEVVIITSSFKAAGLELRRRGFRSMLREKYPEVKVVDIAEGHEDVEQVCTIVKDLIKKHPHLSGIYVTEGATPHAVAKTIHESKKSGKIKFVTHDLTDELMPYVKEGVVTGTLGQDPYAQGHDPVIYLFNYLIGGWKPPTPRLLTRMDVVTPDNYQQFWKEGKGVIQSSLDYYAKPIQKISKKLLKIMVLGRYSSPFWYPVRDGALAAVKELKPFNVQVDWIAPKTKISEIMPSDFKPYFDQAVKEGYHGLAMITPHKDMVPYINNLVESGIPVITFNCEPESLRGLVYTITEQAENLMELSENLASSSNQANNATAQIKNAMHEMADGSVLQNEEVTRTQETVKSLLDNIEKINREATEGARASENTAKAVGQGTDAMEKTLTSMQTIEKSVEDTWHIVEELGKHSERIDSIVELIDDIASRVNVLALNAAMEATRAGEYGKGFMVVANEIRKLAKSTAEATQEVTELVNTVQNGIHKVEKVMSGGLERVKESAEMTSTAQSSLSKIRKLVEVDKERMQKIAGTIKGMQGFSNQVGEAMGTVAVVSEKNTESVEQVNSATQQVSAQLEELATLAQTLSQMSKGEQELLAKFSLSGNGKN